MDAGPAKRRPADLGERLRAALTLAAGGGLTAAERRAVDAVETLRRRVAVSAGQVAFVEYSPYYEEEDGKEILREPPPSGIVRTLPLRYLAEVSSMGPERALVLFRLIRAFQPELVIELGSCIGISSAYLLAALTLNRHGRLVTFEGGETVAAEAARNLRELGHAGFEVVVGRLQDTLPGVLARGQPVDLAVVDGEHAERATLDCHGWLLDAAADHALIYYDDIRWSEGMERAWRRISAATRDVRAVADLEWAGVCLVERDYRGRPERIAVDGW